MDNELEEYILKEISVSNLPPINVRSKDIIEFVAKLICDHCLNNGKEIISYESTIISLSTKIIKTCLSLYDPNLVSFFFLVHIEKLIPTNLLEWPVMKNLIKHNTVIDYFISKNLLTLDVIKKFNLSLTEIIKSFPDQIHNYAIDDLDKNILLVNQVSKTFENVQYLLDLGADINYNNGEPLKKVLEKVYFDQQKYINHVKEFLSYSPKIYYEHFEYAGNIDIYNLLLSLADDLDKNKLCEQTITTLSDKYIKILQTLTNSGVDINSVVQNIKINKHEEYGPYSHKFIDISDISDSD